MPELFYVYYGCCVNGAEWHIETPGNHGKKHSIECRLCETKAPTVPLILVTTGIDDENKEYKYSVRSGRRRHSRDNKKWVYAYQGWCEIDNTQIAIDTMKNYGPEYEVLCPLCIDWP